MAWLLVIALVLGLGALAVWRPYQSWFGSGALKPECVATSSAGTARLAPDQTANAALIAAVAASRGLSPRAVTIALATALQESKLRNLDYGDRDSLGLFQQRPSQGWGTAEQVQDPIYASNRFFDELVKVPDYETLPITEAAQAVQRSAFPLAYARHETTARSFASVLTGYTPAGLTTWAISSGAGLSCQFGSITDQMAGAAQLAAAYQAQWGLGVARVSDYLVVIEAADATSAWAVAAWALAQAGDMAIDEVRLEGQSWTRSIKDHWQLLDMVGPPLGEVTISFAPAGPPN